jgi:hypothetical protein
MRDTAATVYVLCAYFWATACIGVCTYLVFWRDHSGWWYLLALFLCRTSAAENAAKIKGTWRPEMEDDE